MRALRWWGRATKPISYSPPLPRGSRPEITVGARLIGNLLEIQPGPATSHAVLAAAMGLGKRLKKVAVHGFIAERMLQAGSDIAALEREGKRLLEEGVALRAVDIDIACIHGCGYPRRLGGPLFYAEALRASSLPSPLSTSA